MKRIVAFGDSNTWGYKAVSGERYSEEERWPCLLQNHLGDGYRIEEEGLNGRTTAFDDPVREHMSGAEYIECCLDTNSPVDLVIIMLGTNDLKTHFGNTAFFVAEGMKRLVDKALKSGSGINGKAPMLLIISPIEIGGNVQNCETGYYLDASAVEQSRNLKFFYQRIAKDNGCYFLRASDYACACSEDAVHLDLSGHKALAEAVYKKVKEIFKD